MYLNRIYIGSVLYFCTVSQGYFRVSLSVQGGSINYVLCIIYYILYHKAVTEFSLSVQTLLGGSIYYLLYIISYILYHKAVTEFSMSLGWKKHISCTIHHISFIISQGTGWRKHKLGTMHHMIHIISQGCNRVFFVCSGTGWRKQQCTRGF